jgi:membrane protease YdiL (CAAX protease family)
MNVSAKSFFIFTFSWSCLFWFLTTKLGGTTQLPGSLLFYVGGAGPVLAALILIHFRESRAIQKDFWISTFDPRRMSLMWLLVALLIHPFLMLCASVADFALGGEVQGKTDNLNDATAWVLMILAVFFLGPLPEEMGWRGVALDRLQMIRSPIVASLILGFAWSLWHVPLFLIEGTFQAQVIGLGSLRFWIFLATMIPLTIIMTWVYNNTNRSTLSAVFVHFTGNICGALLVKTNQLAALELIALLVAAVCLCIKWPDLGYRPLAADEA